MPERGPTFPTLSRKSESYEPAVDYAAALRNAESGGRNEPEEVSGFIRKEFAARLAELVPREGGVVVDISCGRGRNTEFVSGLGYEVISIDPSSGNLEEAKRRLEDGAHVTFVQSFSDHLPLPDSSADAVMAQGGSFLLDGTWASAKKYMAEVARVLKPGGLFAMVVRSARDNEAERRAVPDYGLTAYDIGTAPGEEVYRHYFTKEQLAELFAQNNLEVVYQIEQDTDRRQRAGLDPVFDEKGEERRVWTWRTILQKKN